MSDEPAFSKGGEKRGRPILPGQVLNPAGRPKGSRNKLDELFVKALYEDFKSGGVEAIRKCREDKPDVYLGVIAKVVPKQVDVKADESLANLADGLHAVASFLGSFAAEASGADLAGMVPDGSVLPPGARPTPH
jgi:hypothetical protein